MMSSTETTAAVKPGSVICFCDEYFEVLANHGSSGKVKELAGDLVIEPFYWHFEGEACTVVPHEEPCALKARHKSA